jgi:superfamily II DNA or RNA helicase
MARCTTCEKVFYYDGPVEAECALCRGASVIRSKRAARQAAAPVRVAWKFRYPLKAWQKEAVSAWQHAGRRGVVEAATGSGKTAVALAAMENLRAEFDDNARVAIVVPTIALAHQWRDQLETNLGLRGSLIGDQHSDALIDWKPSHAVLITVVDSARDGLARVLHEWKTRGLTALLVVDECHRSGSEYNSRIFDGDYDFSLGLSATPERDDEGHIEFVYPGLGEPVYRYPLLTALDDGVLAPVVSVNLYVDFDIDEQKSWDRQTTEIGASFQNLKRQFPQLLLVPDALLLARIGKLAKKEVPAARSLLKLLSDRKQLLSSARARLACQRSILEWLAAGGQRALVFHETISAAEMSHEFLNAKGVRAVLDHSQLSSSAREHTMLSFRQKRAQVLVAVRALDEGIDVPDASVAVIAAGSRSRRQRIQRFGRVLRPAEGKRALVITILVRGTPEESVVGRGDDALLGKARVRHYQWPETSVAAATTGTTSSYIPAEHKAAIEDVLTRLSIESPEPRVSKPPNRKPLERQTRANNDSGRVFSINVWYEIDDVWNALGLPRAEFDRLRLRVRQAFRNQLDPANESDATLIHGSEIEAVRREARRRPSR